MTTKLDSNEFDDLLDTLENAYIDEVVKEHKEADTPIGEFLDNQMIDREFVKKINPVDVIRAISDCDLNRGFLCGKHGTIEYTPRFKILMGLCECVTYVSKEEPPKFKKGDLCYDENREEIVAVTEYLPIREDYFVKDTDGNKNVFRKALFEDCFKKVGEIDTNVLDDLERKSLDKEMPF